jgi:membrane-associated HD superfamily phosphohydrolase
MRLTYETGVATLIQFITLSFLNIGSTVSSIIDTCHHNNNSDCVTNMLSSVVFYLLIVSWFGIIAAIGYRAQTNRSRRMAKILILSELVVFVVAAYNIKLGLAYHNNAISLFTSLIDTILAIWVITLAFRLTTAKGGRVVGRHRSHIEHDHRL